MAYKGVLKAPIKVPDNSKKDKIFSLKVKKLAVQIPSLAISMSILGADQ